MRRTDRVPPDGGTEAARAGCMVLCGLAVAAVAYPLSRLLVGAPGHQGDTWPLSYLAAAVGFVIGAALGDRLARQTP